MRIVVLAVAVAVFLLFTALLARAGRKADRMRQRINMVRGAEREYADEQLKKTFAERVLQPLPDKLTRILKQATGGKKNAGSMTKNMRKLDKQLRAAALPLSAQEFTLAKSVLTIVFLVGGGAAALLIPIPPIFKLLVLIVAMCIPVYGARFFLNGRVKRRKESIMHDLPDVMDLLVVSVEAGLGLDAAIARLYDKNHSPVLTELAAAIREVQMGVPRKNALREMAERCDVKQLTTFVTALIQAEQLGVSLKGVLAVQSERLRVERKQMIQAKALKAPIKIMIPTVFCIFPVMFIILLGPAALSLIDIFK